MVSSRSMRWLLAYLMCERHVVFDDCGAVVGACWSGRGGILPCGVFGLDERLAMPSKRGLLVSVLTDVQFWVPVVVLVAGLVLLSVIR